MRFLPNRAWSLGTHVHKIKDGILGPFGSRRYQTLAEYRYCLGVGPRFPGEIIVLQHAETETPAGTLKLDRAGILWIPEGFVYDGPSGPTLDDSRNFRASCVHDALYMLMAENKLSWDFRERADNALRNIMLVDGANRVRAWYYYWAVRLGYPPLKLVGLMG